MKFSTDICLIVDAFSTGKHLAPAFNSQGYQCIHIKSSENLPSTLKHNSSDFINNIVYRQNLDQLLAELAPYSDTIKWSIAGSESGVLLASLIAEQLGLVGNSSKYCIGYRNKNIMNTLIKDAGLKATAQIKSHSVDEVLQWSELQGKPVVIKPVDSANGDGVFFCFNEQEIRRGCEIVLNSTNQFGEKNVDVICEAFNDGQEYIVNTVSWAGQTCFAEIWRTTRKPYSTIYDKAELVDSNDPAWIDITAYTLNVLTALNIKYGAATTELKYTRDKGAQLLETSNRLMSGAPLSLTHHALGFHQLSLCLEAYLEPDKFQARLVQPNTVKLKKFATVVVLISNADGRMMQDLDTSVLKQLSTIKGYVINGERGELLAITKDSLSSPGEVYLLSDNQSELDADVQRIREWEKTVYQNALMPTPQNISTDISSLTSSFFGDSNVDPEFNSNASSGNKGFKHG